MLLWRRMTSPALSCLPRSLGMPFLRASSRQARHFPATGRVPLFSLRTQVRQSGSGTNACVLKRQCLRVEASQPHPSAAKQSSHNCCRSADNLDARRKLESWQRRSSEPNPVTAHLPGELSDTIGYMHTSRSGWQAGRLSILLS